jgi:hypothetical protein
VRLFLSEHTGDARPDTLIYLCLRDIDTIAEEFGATVEQLSWGAEVWLRDPDGNRLRVGMPIPIPDGYRQPGKTNDRQSAAADSVSHARAIPDSLANRAP